jgi:hypothetical protein
MMARRSFLVVIAVLTVTGGAMSPAAQAPRGRPEAATREATRDLSGRSFEPFKPAGSASVMFFVQTDCPISNWYAPTIQRVCREYAGRGVSCALIYEDVELPGAPIDAQVRTHLEEYRYDRITAAVDRSRAVATRARATVTPQVVVVDRSGAVRYRGRIDNAYADFGRPRQQVTSHELRDALDALLAGRPIVKPETEALGCFIVDPASLRSHHE